MVSLHFLRTRLRYKLQSVIFMLTLKSVNTNINNEYLVENDQYSIAYFQQNENSYIFIS